MSRTIIVEGNTDRAIVKVIAPGLDVPTPESGATQGREAAIVRAAVAAKQVGERRIALLLDRNSHMLEQLEDEVTKALREHWNRPTLELEGGAWTLDALKSVRLVVAGLPEDERLRRWGVTRFMADDYLLSLCLRDDSLEAFCDKERNLSWRPADATALERVLVDVAKTFDRHQVPLSSSKRYVHLILAALGFEATRARFAEALIKRAPPVAVEEILGGLRRDLSAPSSSSESPEGGAARRGPGR